MKSIITVLLGAFSFIALGQDGTNDKSGLGEVDMISVANDSMIAMKLEDIGMRDQTLRLLLPDVTSRFGRDSKEYKYIWSLIEHEDSVCSEVLVDILEEHGWLGISRVGESANQYIWLIIQHAELETQELYLPLLKESVKKEESPGWHLAYLEDRILMRNKQNQKYGTQSFWDQDLKKNKIYPIEDVSTVDERREELGLESMEEYANRYDYVFDQK